MYYQYQFKNFKNIIACAKQHRTPNFALFWARLCAFLKIWHTLINLWQPVKSSANCKIVTTI